MTQVTGHRSISLGWALPSRNFPGWHLSGPRYHTDNATWQDTGPGGWEMFKNHAYWGGLSGNQLVFDANWVKFFHSL